MNESDLKSLVKEIVRECILEVTKSNKDKIPKGSLARLNPKIADSGKRGKMQLPPKGQSKSKLPSPVKEEEAGETDTAGCDGAKNEADMETEKIIHVLSLLTRKLKNMTKKSGAIDEGGPQYKVVDGHSYVEQPGKTNRAREIQCDPTVNEVNKKKVTKENHKVQARSFGTVKDLPNNPKNVRDPEVP